MEATANISISRFQNVELDPKSAYTFEELNENVFLVKFFDHLQSLLGARFKDYQFYLFANLNCEILPDALYKETAKKKVLFYLSNQYHEINPALPGSFHAVFKCHLDQDCVRERIFHFPLGYVKDTIEQEVVEFSKRKVKVFFSGNLNTKRVPLYKALSDSSLPDILYGPLIRISKKIPNLLKREFPDKFPSSYLRFTNGFKKGLNPEEYSKIIYNSQIVLCPGGFLKNETYRHFEALRAGCVIISEKLPETYLYKDAPIIQVENWKEGIEMAEAILESPSLLQQYHQDTLKWWEKVCSEKATAKKVRMLLERL